MATQFVCDRCGDAERATEAKVSIVRVNAEIKFDDMRPDIEVSDGRWELCRHCRNDVVRLIRQAPARQG